MTLFPVFAASVARLRLLSHSIDPATGSTLVDSDVGGAGLAGDSSIGGFGSGLGWLVGDVFYLGEQ
jgi:hypothetical protein